MSTLTYSIPYVNHTPTLLCVCIHMLTEQPEEWQGHATKVETPALSKTHKCVCWLLITLLKGELRCIDIAALLHVINS